MKTILVDAYNTFVTEEGVNREMHVMLETFPNKKIILTNANEEKQVEFWLVNLPYPMFTQNFDPLKHDPEFYRTLLKEYNLQSDDCIYFEHDIKAVESARSIWIETFHYDYVKKDVDEVKAFLQSNVYS